jgi:hypothetical protein
MLMVTSSIRENHRRLRELPGGLSLRCADPADADALAEFNSRIHSEEGPDKPDAKIAAWTRDLLTRPHPTFAPGDFTIVEDPATGQIVSSLNLIGQTWTYAGIPFGVGRIELVGTLPEYRKRGLVRAQFEVVHEWSRERGQVVQAITGIPYYYRQFGYEMTVNLGGMRNAFAPNIPRLKPDEAEPYPVRAATLADIPVLRELDALGARRSRLAVARDEALWRYELEGRSFWDVNRYEWAIVEAAGGAPVGMLAHSPWAWEGGPGAAVAAFVVELRPGVSWPAALPSILRYLWARGEAYAARDGKPFGRVAFVLGSEHPVYDAIPSSLSSTRPPYAWYLRVADLPGFLRLVTPALEQNLAQSIAAGHTGEVKLSFNRSGLRLKLEAGRLTSIEPWQPAPRDDGDVAFPDLTFLHLLFGHRTLDEVRAAFPDCWWSGDTPRAVVMALFPKQASMPVPVA